MIRAEEMLMIKQLSEHGAKEATRTTAKVGAIPRAGNWGWLPALSLTSASGLLILAWAVASASVESEWALGLMYAGLLTIFVPVAARLLSAQPARRERIGLVLVLGFSLYLVKLLRSPLLFTNFDELLHWRTANDLIQNAHLFQANSLLPISPLYPGLEIVTSAVIRVSGLSIFQAGIIVTMIARLLFVLGLFLFFEEVGNSARVGGIAALLYMTNPGFVFFDAQFAYESLALPLGLFALLLIARRLRHQETYLGATLATLLVIGSMAVTHHLTSFAFIGFLILLLMVRRYNKQSAQDHTGLGWLTAFGVVTVLAWLILVASPVVNYLAPYTIGAVQQVIGLILNEVAMRPLFTDYAGQGSPPWERVISFASIALILLGLPWGLRQIWRHYREHSVAVTLGLVSLAYIALLPLRLIPHIADVSARSAEFLSLAIAFVLTVGPVRDWLFNTVGTKRVALVTLLTTILFLGGFILGAGAPWARLPGPYLVSADMRSIEPEGIAAANWARAYLGPGNRVAADRTNSLLMGSFGLQRSVTHINDNVDVSPLFFSLDFGKEARAILAQGDIRYIVVDHRLSTGLPRFGVYFESGEVDSFQHKTPIASAALAKFDQIDNVNRVFDSGDIVIYEIGALNDQP
jgi:hypothetical protein